MTDDPRPALLRAADQIARLVTPDVDLVAPTPCGDWTVDDLLAHVLTVHHRALRVGPADRPVDVPHQLPRDSAEHIPFGPVVEVPDDAGPYDRLVGWLGRDPAVTASR